MHRVDLTDLARISEAHFADLHGAAMQRFSAKYKNAGPEFYVNFNPVVSDPRDKTILGQQMDSRTETIGAPKGSVDDLLGVVSDQRRHPTLYETPNHHDPIGTYAYPADYVANHWHDLHYGSDMGNLRVLKARLDPEKTLVLSDMTEEYFIQAMKRLNLEFHVKDVGWFHTRSKRDSLAIYEAIFQEDAPNSPYMRVNSYGKVLFKLIQHKYTFAPHVPKDEDEEEDEYAEPPHSSAGTFVYNGPIKPDTWHLLSQQQQTKRLTKAGYDVVIDRAKTPLEATIYPEEPEQAIFLTKRSYEVVDVFKIKPTGSGRETIKPGKEDRIKLVSKAAWQVAQAMGEPIIGTVSKYFNKQKDGGIRIKNLSMLRHWIATERYEQTPMFHGDPTARQETVDAWITTRGSLIVMGSIVSQEAMVEDPKAKDEARRAVSKARVRPGEDQHEIAYALNDHVNTSGGKTSHRKYGAHNTLSFEIGLVTPAAQPTFIKTSETDSLKDLPAMVQAALKKNASTAPFRRIDANLLEQYLKLSQKRPTMVKPNVGSAADASPGNPPTATPAAPGGTSAHPAP